MGSRGSTAVAMASRAALEPPTMGAVDDAEASHKTVPLCSSDEEVVEAHVGVNATAHLMRHRLKKMGTTPALNAAASSLLKT